MTSVVLLTLISPTAMNCEEAVRPAGEVRHVARQ
jgi:hypothetical protein